MNAQTAAAETAIEEDYRIERNWLVNSVFPEVFSNVKTGIDECATLLQRHDAVTLPVTDPRVDDLKGVISRVGCNISRIDLHIRFQGRKHIALQTSMGRRRQYTVPQLVDAVKHIRDAQTDSREQLTLANSLSVISRTLEAVQSAKESLQSPGPADYFPYSTVDNRNFDPVVPSLIPLSILVRDAALVVEARLLHSVEHESHMRQEFDRLNGSSLFGQTFNKLMNAPNDLMTTYSALRANDGQFDKARYKAEDVYVVEKMSVEVQDPLLLTCLVKLSALESTLKGMWRKALLIIHENA